MATATCGAVPPLAASVTWNKTGKFAAIFCELLVPPQNPLTCTPAQPVSLACHLAKLCAEDLPFHLASVAIFCVA